MALLEKQEALAPTSASALSKAVVRAADYLGLNQKRTASIIGFSESTASRLWRQDFQFDSSRNKEWERAILFFRLFRSLDSILGDQESARKWLVVRNNALGGIPLERIETTEGLVDAVRYLDAHRGLI